MIKPQKLYLISAFLCGLAVMAVEMSASRLLAPYFGNSLYVWTNVIGLVMTALAVGYYLGGKIADLRPNANLYFLLILVTGAWILFIPFVAGLILPILSTGFSNLYTVTLAGSFISVFVLFIVPLLLLGMIVPFTVKLYVHDLPTLGSASGTISTISTIGSLVGTFLPAFVLIPFLGTMRTFIFLGILLILLSALGLKNKWLLVFGVVASLLFFLTPKVFAGESLIASDESPYGFISVTEDAVGIRRLHVENQIGTQSIYDPNDSLVSDRYYYGYFAVLPAMIEDPKNILILGHAGGTFTRLYNEYYPGLSVTGVEIDPAVTRMSKEYMGLSDLVVNIVHADARTYVLNSDEKYDLILVDAYHSASIPAHLATNEFFDLCKNLLNEGGILAVNVASSESEFLSIFENSLAQSFSNILSVQIPSSFNTMLVASSSYGFSFDNVPHGLMERAEYIEKNRISVAYDSALPIFTDDKLSQVELLNEDMFFKLLQTQEVHYN